LEQSAVVAASTLILSRADVAALLTLPEYIEAVEVAFCAYAEGKTLPSEVMHIDAAGGEFHAKAGGLSQVGNSYFGIKVNGGFFQNPVLNGLPSIQGIIYLADAETGRPLAVMDSAHITAFRTGAATAVAAKYLAHTDSSCVTVCGAGQQARVQLASLCLVRPIERAFVWDRHPESASAMAKEMTERLNIPVSPIRAIRDGSLESQIVVTCTPSREPFLHRRDISKGTFIAAVGADSFDKQEIESSIVAEAIVVTDITDQCATSGELHHAIAANLVDLNHVHAEIGQIIAKQRPGRTAADQLIVFDSTGTSLQDVACAAVIYRKALATRRGVHVTLSDT
jgi:alanine dehydrogenase